MESLEFWKVDRVSISIFMIRVSKKFLMIFQTDKNLFEVSYEWYFDKDFKTESSQFIYDKNQNKYYPFIH